MLFLLHLFVIYSSWFLLLYFSSSFVSSLSHLCVPVSSVADGPTISCRKEQSYNIQRLKWESTAACLYCSCCIFFMWLFLLLSFLAQFVVVFLLFPNLNFPKTSDIYGNNAWGFTHQFDVVLALRGSSNCWGYLYYCRIFT